MPLLIVVVGPTAVGKTDLAVRLAQKLNTEILTADSMQVYRFLDIGTAKPTKEEQQGVPHHLIDLANPDEPFTVVDYQEQYKKKLNELEDRPQFLDNHVTAILSGGTGLYVKAVTQDFAFPDPPANSELRNELRQKAAVEGNTSLHQWLARVDPESATKIHVNDLKRILRALEVYINTGTPFSQLQKARVDEVAEDTIYIGLTRERSDLYERIELRVDKMIKDGLLDEVHGLMEKGYGPELQSMQGLGYKEIIPVLKGESSLGEAIELLKKRTRHYAKRQLTWFRREPIEEWFHLEKGDEKKTFLKILGYIEGRISQVSNRRI